MEPYSCDGDYNLFGWLLRGGNSIDVVNFSVTSCIIPGTSQKKGQCVTPDQCPELVSLEFEPNFSYKKYLKERRCESDEHGVGSNGD